MTWIKFYTCFFPKQGHKTFIKPWFKGIGSCYCLCVVNSKMTQGCGWQDCRLYHHCLTSFILNQHLDGFILLLFICSQHKFYYKIFIIFMTRRKSIISNFIVRLSSYSMFCSSWSTLISLIDCTWQHEFYKHWKLILNSVN
jgi:hypothetical protein